MCIISPRLKRMNIFLFFYSKKFCMLYGPPVLCFVELSSGRVTCSHSCGVAYLDGAWQARGERETKPFLLRSYSVVHVCSAVLDIMLQSKGASSS